MRLLAVALFLAVPVSASAAGPARDYWQAKDCARPYSAREAHRGIAKVLRNHSPLSRPEGKRVWRLSQCAHSRGRARANIKYANTLRRWRHTYAHRWPIRFNRLSAGDRAWAISTSSCESGMNPRAYNPAGPYLGAFQFLIGTWQSAGGQGNPMDHSWAYQAIIAVGLMHREGAQHWPQCGV